jgi:hypothetical protein
MRCFCQADKRRSQPANDLYRARAILANLVEGKREIVLPCRQRNNQTKPSVAVRHISRLQIMPAEAPEKIFGLIDCLNGGGRIIDCGRQRFDRDVN